VFVDDVGNIKGLTVIRVLPRAAPMDESEPEITPVFLEAEERIGLMDPFWWQHPENVSMDVFPNGGAMTCTFTLDNDLELDDSSWHRENAKIARRDSYLEKPVQLADGKTIGKIINETNYLSLGELSMYPLLKLQRSNSDRANEKGPRNGAMVFAQDGGMIGIIVAMFGDGEYYSVAPIADVMEWHKLRFLDQAVTSEIGGSREEFTPATAINRQIICSPGLLRLLEG